MALNLCTGCTTKFAVGLARCPHCRSTDFQEDGVMPKITRHGGPSVAGVTIAEAQWGDGDEQEASTSADEATAPEPVEEESSPGSSSSVSTETPQQNSEPSEPKTLSPAPTTGSRSRKGRTGSRSASGTAGGQETGTSAPDAE